MTSSAQASNASQTTNLKRGLARRWLMGMAAVLLLLAAGRVQATNHEVHIMEVMAGANGNSKIQFIVLQQEAIGQNLWGPGFNGQSAAMLVFFDATGRETGKFKFPANPPTGGTLKVLAATQEFASLPGAPVPDVIIPPLLNAINGKICFRNNPLNAVFFRNECLSYGAFTGDTEINSGGNDNNVPAGPPAPSLPIMNTVSLRRIADTSRNADFTINNSPTPTNIAGQTFSMPVASQIVQGENLFNNETFQGNGRTCASCHVKSDSFRFTPDNVQSRFAGLSTTFDPQFIGETAPSTFDAGFDFNLNTLILTAEVPSGAPCTGELRGIITAGAGRAKVLTRISPTAYLVYGGRSPQLSGTVSDSHSCSATVASISAGDLNNLEAPLRMRKSGHPDFPQGRGLILENIDGFPNPPVFRKSPQLLNLSRTAPFGFSGDIPDLQTFSTGAVTQHFPRSLARNSGGANPDFRLPTASELAAMEAFMLSLDFPSGSDPNKFDLNRFVTSAAEIRGRDAFFGAAKCSQCHGGTVLAQTTVPITVEGVTVPIGINGAFNTGVVNQPVNAVDSLPCEPTSGGACGSRKFSTPQLFNVKNLGPFFHDASAATLRQAVEFYDSVAFNTSPAGMAIGGISLSGMVDDITAFLEGLSVGTISANSATNVFGATGGFASPAPSVIVRDKSGNPVAGVTVTFAIASGGGSITGASQVSNASGVATVGGWTLGSEGTLVATTTSDGFTGSPITFTAVPFPTLSSISPNSSLRGISVDVILTGSNFVQEASSIAVSGIGVTVSNTSVLNATSITARFTIATDAEFGAHNVTVTTNGGTSGSATFTVTIPVPSFNSLSPAVGVQNSAVSVTLSGSNFVSGFSAIVISGTGVTVSNITVVSPVSITATFTIAAGAALGARNVTINNGGAGSVIRTFTVVPPPPTLTVLSPNSGLQNSTVPVTLTGTNFVSGATNVIVSGIGISASSTVVVSPTSLTTALNVLPGATLGSHDVTVTTSGGTTSAVPFTVSQGVPVLSSISPGFGVRGSSVNVTLTGLVLDTASTTITISPPTGLTIRNTSVTSSTAMSATFDIAAVAPSGVHTVTVTTGGGTSGSVNFNVTDPFPDFTLSSVHTGNFGVGFNETYLITVNNIGTAASTSAITVTDTLPSGLSFVSGSGTGWTCSAVSQTVTCTRTSSLAVSSSTAITLTAAAAAPAAPSVTNSVSVSSTEDVNSVNNSASDLTTVVATPLPTFTFLPTTLVAGQQATLALAITAPFPHDISGVVTLAFTSNATNPLDDPAIQFASGGRVVPFTFKANTTQAAFAGASIAAPIGFQTGTVSGTFSFTGTLTAGTVQRLFSQGSSLSISTAPPQILSSKTIPQQGGFNASITLQSTVREVTQVTVTFNTTPAVKLTCGNPTGCTASGSRLTFDVKSLFDAWYASDTTFGSMTNMSLPITISGGTVSGTVAVTLGNKLGTSNSVTFTIP